MSTALIPLAASVDTAPAEPQGGRPRADFLAQLIATLTQAPQTRLRRRAEPEEAIAAYCCKRPATDAARPRAVAVALNQSR